MGPFFHLKINGKLSEIERSKLLSLIGENKIGISEVELEPQFEAGKIILPRLTEYAVTLMLQGIRDFSVSVQIEMIEPEYTSQPVKIESVTAEIPIDTIPLHTSAFPKSGFKMIETFASSVALRSDAVEVLHSREYEKAIEQLQTSIRQKAKYHGANALFEYQIKLDYLPDPRSYRLTATAVGAREAST